MKVMRSCAVYIQKLWRNLCKSLSYFVVRVRCRSKESSRSLSHLLMSFLYLYLSIGSLKSIASEADCTAKITR